MKRPEKPSQKERVQKGNAQEEISPEKEKKPQSDQKGPFNRRAFLLGLFLFALIGLIYYSTRSTNPDSPLRIAEKASLSPQEGWTSIGSCGTNFYYVKDHKLHGLQANGRELFTWDLGEEGKVSYGQEIAVLKPDFSLCLLDPQTGEVKKEISAPESLDLCATPRGKSSYAVFFKDKIRLYDSKLKVVGEILDLQDPFRLAVQDQGEAWLEQGPTTMKEVRSQDEGTVFWDEGIAPLPAFWPSRSYLGLKDEKKTSGLPSQRPYLDVLPLGQGAFVALTRQDLLIIKNHQLLQRYPLQDPRSWDSGFLFVVLDGDKVRRFTEEGKELPSPSLSFTPKEVKIGKEACFAFGEGTFARIGESTEEKPLKLDEKLSDPFVRGSGRLEVFTDQGLMNLDTAKAPQGTF